MNSISIFLKNRQRNKLLNQIKTLKNEAAFYKERSLANQLCADRILSRIEFHKEGNDNGKLASSMWLNTHLNEQLKRYSMYSEKAFLNHNLYEKATEQIDVLTKQLNNF